MAGSLPLDGVTVIDFGQIYNGPYATFLMAMAGARVIKIEPKGGENMRRRGAVGGAMVPFAMLNSNKEFVTLDLKHRGAAGRWPSGWSRRPTCVVENFAPGVMDRLGLGPDHLLALNPRLIYAAGTGFGWTGPYRDYPAMDLTVQAMAGIMNDHRLSRPAAGEGRPRGRRLLRRRASLRRGGDRAVRPRAHRQGPLRRGLDVRVGLRLAVLGLGPATSASGGAAPPRTGNRHGGLAEAPYNVYRAADGYMALICVSETHWKSLLKAMDRDRPRRRPAARQPEGAASSNMESSTRWSAPGPSGTPAPQLDELLMRHRVPCAPVRDLDEVVQRPAHARARHAPRWSSHPILGDVVLPASADALRRREPIDELRPSKRARRRQRTPSTATGWASTRPSSRSSQGEGAI